MGRLRGEGEGRSFWDNMSLKKAFFLLSVCGVLVSAALLWLVWVFCAGMRREYPSGGIAIYPDGTMAELEKPTKEEAQIQEILTVIPFAAGVFLPILSLGVAGVIFYRWKLKTPIALLREGTERIRRHDLDFTFPSAGGDELGEVCCAFEQMRAELEKTNRELWRQSEERRRLNAAFAHDLRNPVTVLKGTVRLLKENRQDSRAIERLEAYTMRIEQYIEAMSSVQKLEQIPVRKEEVPLSILCGELEETARLLCPSLAVEVSCAAGGESRSGEAERSPRGEGDDEAERSLGGEGEDEMERSLIGEGGSRDGRSRGREGGSEAERSPRGEDDDEAERSLIGEGGYGAERGRRAGKSRRLEKESGDGKKREKADERKVALDHGIFLTVAENLICNAARFAEKEIKIALEVQDNTLMLSVADDGPGFSEKMLKEGPKPFGREEGESRHFGMGLYSSSLLCGKQGGDLRLENREKGGALVTACFDNS